MTAGVFVDVDAPSPSRPEPTEEELAEAGLLVPDLGLPGAVRLAGWVVEELAEARARVEARVLRLPVAAGDARSHAWHRPLKLVRLPTESLSRASVAVLEREWLLLHAAQVSAGSQVRALEGRELVLRAAAAVAEEALRAGASRPLLNHFACLDDEVHE